MATPAQNQAAITAAIQAAATADLSLLNTFATANGPSFTTLMSNLVTLAGEMSDNLRAQQVTGIHDQLNQVLGSFNTLVSTTTAAQTATPLA